MKPDALLNAPEVVLACIPRLGDTVVEQNADLAGPGVRWRVLPSGAVVAGAALCVAGAWGAWA